MIIGAISDTHDNLLAIEKVVERLNEENVELVLHAGDYISPFVIPKFQALRARLIGVYGNNDGGRQLLKEKSITHGRFELRGNFARVKAGNMEIVMLHGDDEELLKALIDCQAFDIVIHGHVHTAEIQKIGKTLSVNPGEVCGYLSGKSTLALIDTDKREAKIIEI